ncbi:histidine phosphatase family protein [Candidatus Pacearchaeota archaeon]|nr:hypothetical protein [uncultured archaeon]AQS29419.1 hypothetical protein [uncultured archaeon]AQS34047.1 hypothetical protein [uncultured archaeon]MBS3093742.1 histidine phosphatase family protein [Candidatus Pacearchaeota archaeon]
MKKEEYFVYIFRHGQTDFNKKHIFTGWKDSKLTALGKKQAQLTARKLQGKKIEIAVQTRLSRSQDTLKEVLKFHPECKKVITDNRIIERNYGKLNGTAHKEFIRKIGRKEYDLLKEGDAIENLSVENRKKVEKILGEEEFKIIHRGYDVRPLQGESFADVEKRVGSFIKYLEKLIKKDKKNIAISAHGNSIRLFRKILEKKSKEEAVQWFIPFDKVFAYSFYY